MLRMTKYGEHHAISTNHNWLLIATNEKRGITVANYSQQFLGIMAETKGKESKLASAFRWPALVFIEKYQDISIATLSKICSSQKC